MLFVVQFLKGQRTYPTIDAARRAIQLRRLKYLDSFNRFLFAAPYPPNDRMTADQAQRVVAQIWDTRYDQAEAEAFAAEN